MSDELPPLNIEWTNVFKRDYKRAMKRNLDITLLDDISLGSSLDANLCHPTTKTIHCATTGLVSANATLCQIGC